MNVLLTKVQRHSYSKIISTHFNPLTNRPERQSFHILLGVFFGVCLRGDSSQKAMWGTSCYCPRCRDTAAKPMEKIIQIGDITICNLSQVPSNVAWRYLQDSALKFGDDAHRDYERVSTSQMSTRPTTTPLKGCISSQQREDEEWLGVAYYFFFQTSYDLHIHLHIDLYGKATSEAF